MAYQFSAEKDGEPNLRALHDELLRFGLIEFFPVDIAEDSLTLGISVPFKVMEDPRFETELARVMTYLIVEKNFQVTDLYTGNGVRSGDIAGLAQRISA